MYIYTCNNFIIIYIADHISIFVDTHVKNIYNSRIEHEDKKKNENVCDKRNLRFKLRWRESCTCTIIQSTTEISHRFIRVRFGRNSRHTLIKFGKTWTNLSCSLIMAVAICTTWRNAGRFAVINHFLMRDLFHSLLFGVVVVVAANVVCCLIVVGFLLVGGAVMSPTQLSPCRLKLVL